MTSNQDETLDKAKVPVVKVYATTVTSNLYAARLTPEELVAHHLDKATNVWVNYLTFCVVLELTTT